MSKECLFDGSRTRAAVKVTFIVHRPCVKDLWASAVNVAVDMCMNAWGGGVYHMCYAAA